MYKYYVYGDFPTNTETVRHICTVNTQRKAIEIVGAKYIVKTRGEVSLRRFEPNADYPLTDDMTFALTKFRMPNGIEYENWPEVSCVFRTGCVFASRIPEGHTIVEPHEFESFEVALEAQPYEVPAVKKRLDEDIILDDEAVPEMDDEAYVPKTPPKVLEKKTTSSKKYALKSLPQVIKDTDVVHSDTTDTQVLRIKELLNNVENAKGKENKARSVKILMDEASKHELILGHNPTYRNQIIAKIHELVHDPNYEVVWKTGCCESFRKCCETILALPTNCPGYSIKSYHYGENAVKYEKLARAFLENMYKNFRVISRKEFVPGAKVSLRCSLDWNRDIPFTGMDMTIYVEDSSTFAFKFLVNGVSRCSVNYNKVYDVETGAATNNGF